MKAIYPFVSDTVNLLSYSEDFTNAAWSTTNVTISANQITAPNGTLTADKITDGTLSGGHRVTQAVSTNLVNNATYTYSTYVKYIDRKGIAIVLYYNNTPYPYFNAIFDISTGTLVSQNSANGGTNVNATITSVGSGWYRISVTGILGNFSTNFVAENSLTDDSYNFSYTGSNKSMYIWGSQLEIASSASTYQPIATTPANRFVSQFKYNLKDARDLDAAFRLAFNGTWTYSKQGATPNGVNGYANTFYLESANATLNSGHISYYSRTNIAANAFMGATGLTTKTNIYPNETGGFYPRIQGNNSGVSGLNLNAAAYFIASRTNSTQVNGFRNTTKYTVSSPIDSLNNLRTYYLGANNESIVIYNANQTAFSTIGDGLTDTEATNLYTSVQLFQQELSRYVGVPIVSDANAQAFLDAAVITDQTQANAVNTLVTDLKTYGLWTKMKAIYPFVGGTATTHKWNLKDPRDLDAAYRLAFSGAWTHSSTGALPNGANAYADSFLTPLSALTNNNTHLSYYSRTNTNGTFADIGVSGVGPAYTPLLAIYIRDTDNMATRMYGYDTGENFQSANTNSQGLFIGNRTSSTVLNQWKNSTKLGTATYTNGRNITTLNLKTFIGAMNLGGTASQYTNRESAFASIGDGLSDTESANLYTAVQKYQTSLSRNV
jgi:hypothetical protein